MTLLRLVPWLEAVPVKRSVDFADPCNVGVSGSVGGGGGAAPPDLTTVVADLAVGMEGVRRQASEIKNFTSTLLERRLRAELNRDRYTFIAPGALGSVATEVLQAVTDPLSVLSSHWGNLYNVTALLNYARTHGEIGRNYRDNSASAILRTKMDGLEGRLDSVVCNVYIGLIGLNQSHPFTPNYTVPAFYTEYGIQYEFRRVYILMKDIVRMMEHFHSVYARMR